MIIESDTMQMHSQRSYRSLKIRCEGYRNGKFTRKLEEKASNNEGETVDGERKENPSPQELFKRMEPAYGVKSKIQSGTADAMRKIREQTLDYLLYLLFGRKVSRDHPALQSTDSSAYGTDSALTQEKAQNSKAPDYSFFYSSEEETTCFDTEGCVKTADGREIPFRIHLAMSRSFTRETRQLTDYKSPVFCDPLVVHLDSAPSKISDQKFLFDLDCDGQQEEIPVPGASGAFLALDRNGNGVIDDGSELFGAKSGDGFSELSAFDTDENGWIDEADAIFSRLNIWTKDDSGNDRLIPLKEAGIGAICLRNVDSEFSLTSEGDRFSGNTVNGVVRKTGMFLYENGSGGTIQQVDFAT